MTSPPVTIYTKRWCGYCWAARRLLTELDLEFEEIRLDGQRELRRAIAERAGNWATVPMIFIGDRFVGGYQEIARLHRKGRLLPACGREGP